MHKKINIWIAFLIIGIIAASFAWVISARASAALNFGGKIIKYVPACTMAIPVPGVCPGTPCPCEPGICDCVAEPCVPPPPIWEEIIFIPALGSQTNVICPPTGFRYSGGIPTPGKFILGNAYGVYAPIQIGVSR